MTKEEKERLDRIEAKLDTCLKELEHICDAFTTVFNIQILKGVATDG